jgi:hypothetical protein
VAAHEAVLALDGLGQHLQELDRARRIERRSVPGALAGALAEDPAQAPAQLGAPLDVRENGVRVAVLADHFAELLEELGEPGARALPRERAHHRGRHLHHVEGLLEVVADPVADPRGGALQAAAAGDHDDLGVRELAAHHAHHVLALHAGHVEVERHQLDPLGAQGLQRLGAASGLQHIVVGGEDHAQRLARAALVVHHQYSRLCLRHQALPAPSRRTRIASAVPAHAGDAPHRSSRRIRR